MRNLPLAAVRRDTTLRVDPRPSHARRSLFSLEKSRTHGLTTVNNSRRRGRSRKVKNIRFENSISTIYQTYPSILPCSLTKEKRSKHLSSYSIFQSQSMQRCVSLPRYPTPSLQTFSHNFFLPEKSVAMRFLSVGAGSLERRCIVTSSLVNGACKT